MIILYGIENNYKDVTDIVTKLGLVTLPASDDQRAELFGDHLFGIVKHICIMEKGRQYIYPNYCEVRLNGIL